MPTEIHRHSHSRFEIYKKSLFAVIGQPSLANECSLVLGFKSSRDRIGIRLCR